MYPQGFDTSVSVNKLAQGLCAAHRPGHFDGVCTVVCKLFGIIRPHFAVFGEKDYQQLQIIRRMVRDLSMPIEILGMPVMRELDGLAMSSRNARLKKTQRSQASGLMRAIEAAQKAAEKGERNCAKLIQAAQQELALRPLMKPEYIEIVDPESLLPLKMISTSARILIATKLGDVRLIDNGPIYPQ
jgi:pantoate--beta-alanine ligase